MDIEKKLIRNLIDELHINSKVPMKCRNPYVTGIPIRQDDMLGEHGESLVDRAGYIPLKQQIDNFRRSGAILEAHRKFVYSNEPINDDDVPEYDPTTAHDFDVFDAHDILMKMRYDAKRREQYDNARREEAAAKGEDKNVQTSTESKLSAIDKADQEKDSPEKV